MKVSADCTKVPGGARIAIAQAAKKAMQGLLILYFTHILASRRRRNDSSESGVNSRPSIPSSFLPQIQQTGSMKSTRKIHKESHRTSIAIDEWEYWGTRKPIGIASVLYDYTARSEAEISVNAGGIVNIMELDGNT